MGPCAREALCSWGRVLVGPCARGALCSWAFSSAFGHGTMSLCKRDLLDGKVSVHPSCGVCVFVHKHWKVEM